MRRSAAADAQVGDADRGGGLRELLDLVAVARERIERGRERAPAGMQSQPGSVSDWKLGSSAVVR
jgi:hypothetical protein